MQRKVRVGVIFGGRSGEHEISLASARSIMAVMDRDKYEIVPLGITHEGRWLTSGDPMAILSLGESAPPAPQQLAGSRTPDFASSAEPAAAGLVPIAATVGRELVPGATGGTFPPLDVVLPVLHGPFGEDGTVQGLLEMAGIPYVGCGVLASALAMDKAAARAVFAAAGLPQVPYRVVKRKNWEAVPDRIITELEVALGYPVFVKPTNLGSSIGVSKAQNRAELRVALTEAARYDRKLLVEMAVPHAREIECSVLGNDDPMASVPGEIVPCHEFYDYAAKYIDGQSQLLIPAPLPAELAARVRQIAVRAFLAIDGAGLARVDFLLNGATGELFLSEINTMPGFTIISMYPKLWEASGIPYAELVDRLIELALERHGDRTRCLTTYAGAVSPL
jgi:D-alanine-D-alanine ligase